MILAPGHRGLYMAKLDFELESVSCTLSHCLLGCRQGRPWASDSRGSGKSIGYLRYSLSSADSGSHTSMRQLLPDRCSNACPLWASVSHTLYHFLQQGRAGRGVGKGASHRH